MKIWFEDLFVYNAHREEWMEATRIDKREGTTERKKERMEARNKERNNWANWNINMKHDG